MDSRLLSGTLEMMVLQVVSFEPSYGYHITQEVLRRSEDCFQLKEGSLYPALHKLERNGLLESYWLDTPEGRRRKYYRITAKGVKTLEQKVAEWRGFAAGVNRILGVECDGVA